METWRDVPGFEGRYQVSDLGRVRGRGGKVLKPSKHRDGYLFVVLCRDRSRSSRYVHRLVAQVFVPNPQNLPEVDHDKGNKEDNRATELTWVTRGVNMQRAFALGLAVSPDNRGERNGQATLTADKVREIRHLRATEGTTHEALASRFGVTRRAVSMVISGQRWGSVQ